MNTKTRPLEKFLRKRFAWVDELCREEEYQAAMQDWLEKCERCSNRLQFHSRLPKRDEIAATIACDADVLLGHMADRRVNQLPRMFMFDQEIIYQWLAARDRNCEVVTILNAQVVQAIMDFIRTGIKQEIFSITCQKCSLLFKRPNYSSATRGYGWVDEAEAYFCPRCGVAVLVNERRVHYSYARPANH